MSGNKSKRANANSTNPLAAKGKSAPPLLVSAVGPKDINARIVAAAITIAIYRLDLSLVVSSVAAKNLKRRNAHAMRFIPIQIGKVSAAIVQKVAAMTPNRLRILFSNA